MDIIGRSYILISSWSSRVKKKCQAKCKAFLSRLIICLGWIFRHAEESLKIIMEEKKKRMGCKSSVPTCKNVTSPTVSLYFFFFIICLSKWTLRAVLKGTFFGKVDPFKCHWYQKGTSFKTGTYSSSKTGGHWLNCKSEVVVSLMIIS